MLNPVRLLPTAAIAAAALFAGAVGNAEKAGAPKPPTVAKATRATLVASRQAAGQACPVTITFAGTITASGPAEVKYTFASFDGGTWPEHTLKFTSAGTQKFSETRQVSQTGAGWLQVKVLSPNALQSTRAAYSVSCKAPVHRGK